MADLIVIKIRDDYGNALTVGTLENRVFKTERLRSKHFFVKYNGWAIDRKVAEGIEADTFVLLDKESGKTYTTTKDNFLKSAVPISNFGHREQLCLGEVEWEVTLDKKAEKLSKVMKSYGSK